LLFFNGVEQTKILKETMFYFLQKNAIEPWNKNLKKDNVLFSSEKRY